MSKRKVRPTKLKIHFTKEDRETEALLWHLSHQIKIMVNLIWRLWMLFHWEAGSEDDLRLWREAYKTWAQEGKKGKKPQCPVACFPPECSKRIRAALTERFPGIHGRVRELVLDRTRKRINKIPAKTGAFSGWLCILLNEQRPGFSSDPLPIPLDRKNGHLLAPQCKSDPWRLVVGLDRVAPRVRSPKTSLRLRTWGRRCASERASLEKIVGGEYEFCGSEVVYRPTRREWYAHVMSRQPKEARVELDPGRVAVLHPGRKRIALLRFEGYTWWIGGRYGRHVAHTRNAVLIQLWSRSDGYRKASTARKGHGRNKGFRFWLNKLRNRWRDFVKTQNNEIAKDLVAFCERHRVGRVVYRQPTEHYRLTRFLGRAGSRPRRSHAYTWDWHQLGKICAEKCTEKGILFEVSKRPDGRSRPLNRSQRQRDKEVMVNVV